MKFELIGRTKATLTDIDIQSQKKGQTEVVPAVCLTFKIMLPNAMLNMLDRSLLPFLYAKASPGGQTQAQLDGVEVISDMPALKPAAEKIGPLPWDDEQTGCKLKLYQGATGHGDIRLKDGTARVKKITPKEGGAVEFVLTFYTDDVNAEILGDLGVLKSHEIDIELEVPDLLKQKPLEDKGSKVTPIKTKKGIGTDAEQAERQRKSLAEDDAKAAQQTGPQGPEEALAGAVGLPGYRDPRKETPS